MYVCHLIDHYSTYGYPWQLATILHIVRGIFIVHMVGVEIIQFLLFQTIHEISHMQNFTIYNGSTSLGECETNLKAVQYC